jgi:hypothetical protein
MHLGGGVYYYEQIKGIRDDGEGGSVEQYGSGFTSTQQQNARQQQQNAPQNDCDKFVEYLEIKAAFGALGIAGGMDWQAVKLKTAYNMIDDALIKTELVAMQTRRARFLGGRRPMNGFRQELQANIETRSHILVTAAAMISGDLPLNVNLEYFTQNQTSRDGIHLSQLFIGVDMRERYMSGIPEERIPEKNAELFGDHLGNVVGGWMSRVMSGEMSRDEFRSLATRAICTGEITPFNFTP